VSINELTNCVGQLLTPCRFVMLQLNFGTTALKEITVLDFPARRYMLLFA